MGNSSELFILGENGNRILTGPPLTIFNQNNSLVVHLIKLYDLDPMDGTCNVGLLFLHLCDKSAIGAVGVDSL